MEPFSGLGDVVIIIRLALAVYNHLSNAATNAPREITALAEKVHTLHAVLEFTKQVIESDSSILRGDLKSQTAIAGVLQGCEETLTDLKTVADEFSICVREQKGRRLGNDKRGIIDHVKAWEQAWKRGYKRIEWTCIPSMLEHVHTLMDRHLTELNVVLGGLHVHGIAGLIKLVVPISSNITQVLVLLQQYGTKIDYLVHSAKSPQQPHPFPGSIAPIRPPLVCYDHPVSPSSRCPGVEKPELPPLECIVGLEETELDLSLFDARNGFKAVATRSEHSAFMARAVGTAGGEVLKLIAVKFIYQLPVGKRIPLDACGGAELHILPSHDSPPLLWIFSKDKTTRLHHSLVHSPTTSLIPYTLHGRPRSLVLTTSSHLLFHAPTTTIAAHPTAVPTSWVEYVFENEGDADRAMEFIYGAELVFREPVDGAWEVKGIAQSGRSLVGREEVRVWRREVEGEMEQLAMMKLLTTGGWREWATWDVGKGKVKAKGKDRVRIKALHLPVGEEAGICLPGLSRVGSIAGSTSGSASSDNVAPSLHRGRTIKIHKPETIEDVMIRFSKAEDATKFLRICLNANG